jgi:hypothetical protein
VIDTNKIEPVTIWWSGTSYQYPTPGVYKLLLILLTKSQECLTYTVVMHMISRLKEANIEDIRGITSDTIKELKKLNINSVYQLAVQNPSELAAEYEDTSLTVESASRLVANARKSLKENGALTSEFSTADQFLDKRNKLTRYLLVQRTSMTF